MGDVMVLAGTAQILNYIVRNLFSWIDGMIYGLLVQIYNLLSTIAKINLFGETTLNNFSNRIYTILGVIMLFKLAFSIITYIMDPDKLADSKKGFASIIKNIMIMLVLLLTVPIIFKYAMALQQLILSDNTIGRLILGRSGATDNNGGEDLAYSILSGFVRIDESITECQTLTYNEDCYEKLKTGGYTNIAELYEKAGDTKLYNEGGKDGKTGSYKNEYGYKSLLKMAGASDTINGKGTGGQYVVTYNWLISSVVGGFTAYILLMFLIEIAIRTVKLGFLQLIAPIPIVTYMDDGGQGIFKKWVKACTSTYVSLFVRLAAIDFAIFIIQTLIIEGHPQWCEWEFRGEQLVHTECKDPGFFAWIFLILGTLSFAKQLPKLIEEITGIKMDGNFSLNPMKQLASVPILGGAAAAGAALGGAGALALGRGTTGLIGSGIGAGINKLTNGKHGQSFSSGMGATFDKMKARMGAGWNSAKGTWSNWSGDGKYVSPSMRNDDFKKAKKALEDIEKNDKEGEKLYAPFRKAMANWDGVDENTKPDKDTYLMNLFRNKEFKDSYKNMSDLKGKMYDAQNAVTNAESVLNAAQMSGDQGRIDAARKAYANAKKACGTAESRFKLAEDKHNYIKTMYTEDAARQDSFDRIDKLNPAKSGAELATTATTSNSTSTTQTSSSSSNSPSSSNRSSNLNNSDDMDVWDTLNMMADAQNSNSSSTTTSSNNNQRQYYPNGSGDGDDGNIE